MKGTIRLYVRNILIASYEYTSIKNRQKIISSFSETLTSLEHSRYTIIPKVVKNKTIE